MDTSGLYALADEHDAHHAEAVGITRRLAAEGVQAFTTNYIVAETHVLLLARIHAHAARRWLAGFALPVEQATEEDQAAARSLVLGHMDKDYSLTDAVSFAVMRRLGVRRAFAFDVHFCQFGFEVLTVRQ